MAAAGSARSSRVITSAGFPNYTPDFKWIFYRSLVENYFAANSVTDDTKQKELFIAYLPKELLDIMACGIINLEDMPTISMTKVLDQLTEYFDDEVSVSVCRRNFYRRDRKQQECIVDYANALKIMVSCCNFGTETNAQLCDCFVLGLNHVRLQKILGFSKFEDFDTLLKRAVLLNAIFCDNRNAYQNVNGGGDDFKAVIEQDQIEDYAWDFEDMGHYFEGSIKENVEQPLFTSNHVQESNLFTEQALGGSWSQALVSELQMTKSIDSSYQLIEKQFAAQMDQIEMKFELQKDDFNRKFDVQKQEFAGELATHNQKWELKFEEFNEKFEAQKQEFHERVIDSLEQLNKTICSNIDRIHDKFRSEKLELNLRFENRKQLCKKRCDSQVTLVEQILDAQIQKVSGRMDAEKLQLEQGFAYHERLICDLNKLINSCREGGDFIWCITGVADHIKAAMADSCQSVISPPFYTHRNGYCVSTLLRFNHNNKGHVGIHLRLESGNHDSILAWPVVKQVTFTLNGYRDGVAKSVQKLLGWEEPVKVAVDDTKHDILNFVSLNVLQDNYVNHDKLYITISVPEH